MEELTYEDWQENPTPRMMWVWNSDVGDKAQAKVVSVVKTDACMYPVLAIMKNDIGYDTFRHCAEIRKQRRMTNKELSRWLREKPTREMRYNFDEHTYCYYTYVESDCDEEVNGILIREDDGEWREPLMEVEE